jgi:hypothetical protein
VAEFRTSTTGTNSFVVPVNVQEGDYMVVVLSSQLAMSAPTLSAPTGWTQLGKNSNGSSYSYATFGAYGRLATAGDVANRPTFTWTITGTSWALSMAAYSGVDADNPVDAVSAEVYTTSNTVIRYGNLTTSGANRLLVACGGVAYNGGRSLAPPSGFTERAEKNTNNLTDCAISDMAWPSAGEVADQDGTISAATTNKMGYLVALNPTISGSPHWYYHMISSSIQ